MSWQKKPLKWSPQYTLTTLRWRWFTLRFVPLCFSFAGAVASVQASENDHLSLVKSRVKMCPACWTEYPACWTDHVQLGFVRTCVDCRFVTPMQARLYISADERSYCQHLSTTTRRSHSITTTLNTSLPYNLTICMHKYQTMHRQFSLIRAVMDSNRKNKGFLWI